MSTDWLELAATLAAECPSRTYRDSTAAILAHVERLGPLGAPREEFLRVYRFIQYNDPTHVLRVTQQLLERTREPHPRLRIQANAWRYVVATHDEWIAHARIFYLVAGLLEGALRSRLNQRMTDYFGPEWPADDRLIPAFTRDSLAIFGRVKRFAAIADLAARSDLSAERIVAEVRQLTARPPAAPLVGHVFVSQLSLAALQAFFTTKRLYNGKPQLKELLIDPRTRTAVPRQRVTRVFAKYRTVRNQVAHYTLGSELSFAQALFTAATIAEWLGVDLQHFYSAVDTRQSTELSRLLGAHLADLAQGRPAHGCHVPGCALGEPYDWIITSATPTDGATLTTTSVERACLYHRVQFQAARHRHERLG